MLTKPRMPDLSIGLTTQIACLTQFDKILALLNDDMNLPPNPPFWGTLGLSKSLTCGGFRGRSRKVATHRFILGFSNADKFMLMGKARPTRASH